MHIFVPVARRAVSAADAGGPAAPDAAGQMFIVRDPEDESEWQYLGNPEIAAKTSLKEVVDRFIQDCSGADGLITRDHIAAAKMVRGAFLLAAKQIDDALKISNDR